MDCQHQERLKLKLQVTHLIYKINCVGNIIMNLNIISKSPKYNFHDLQIEI